MTANADLLQQCQLQGIKFVRLQFTDILGAVKSVTIPVEQLPKALEGNLSFDGGAVEGFVRIEESDMLLKPDPTSFAVFPWPSESHMKTARLMCDVYWPSGEPFEGCPRGILKAVMRDARSMGFDPFAGPEPEFFLFRRNPDGSPSVESHDQAGYFDLPPLDRGEAARQDMARALIQMGFEIEASHHEAAPAQHEIDFKYADSLTTADQIATFRFVVRTVALNHNLHATFMPKPKLGINGSGMHVHLSLFKNGENAFYDPEAPYELSEECMSFIAGLMHHCRGFTAITNPLVNSYKRLVPGYEAPVYIAWSMGNRSPLLRIPARREEGTRVELRSPDPSCNPYLALAVVFAAGLEGIKKGMQPPVPVAKNIYRLDWEERLEQDIGSLPKSLDEALYDLEKDRLVIDTLGEHVVSRFIKAKRVEWDEYRSQVHDWELKRYLGAY